MARWMAGAAVAAATALGARAAGALDASGAAAAAILGTLAVAAGWDWGTILVAYFVSTSALSRIGRAERDRRTAGRIEKGGPRDAIQVLANGGLFATAAAGFVLTRAPAWQVLAAASLAASAADTWATEIGTLSRSAARSILTGRRVPAGTSGGVTALGMMAALAGAAFVASVAWLCGWERVSAHAAVIGGVAGAVLDSILGAAVQARWWCGTCGLDTEQRIHWCGTRTDLRGGVRWLDNDGVNAASSFGGALLGTLLATLLAARL